MSKRLFIFIAIAILAASCGKDRIDVDDSGKSYADGVGYLFDDEALPALTIAISEQEWNNLLAAYDKEPHNHDYFRCDAVTLQKGERTSTARDAGLRLRGQTSRRRPEGKNGQKHNPDNPKWHHVHFGLHFRKFSEDGQIAGIRRINLKYAKEDPTYIREHFCFDMLEKFGVWTSPKTSWCRLFIKVGDGNPAYFGVYLMSESIDRQYAKRRPEFGSPDGYLWKCGWGANLRDREDWRFHLDDNSPNTYAYELKEDSSAEFQKAAAQLKGFIKNLNTLKGSDFYNWIQSHCDVDLLLKMYAANVALGHWDDYWNDMNNFYLYFNSRDPENYKLYMLPYDYDNTLGTSHYCGVQSDSGRHDPYHWGLEECVLISKILEVTDFRERYTRYLQELSDNTNPYTGILPATARIRAWHQLITPYLENDTGEDMAIKDRPASWSNHQEYRVLEDGPNNWFRVKSASLESWTR